MCTNADAVAALLVSSGFDSVTGPSSKSLVTIINDGASTFLGSIQLSGFRGAVIFGCRTDERPLPAIYTAMLQFL